LVGTYKGDTTLECAMGVDQQKLLAVNVWSKSFVLHIAMEVGRATLVDGLRIVACAIDQVREFVELLVVFVLSVGVRHFFASKSREIEGARLNLRPVQKHGDAAFDLHVVHAPAGKIEG